MKSKGAENSEGNNATNNARNAAKNNLNNSINDFIKDIKNSNYKNKDSIASMIPYLFEFEDGNVAYALDINAEPKLRKRIAAAITSYKHKVSFEEMLASMDDADYSDETA